MRPFQNVWRNMAHKKSSIYSIIRKSDKINLNIARYLRDSTKLSSHLIDKNDIDHKEHKSQLNGEVEALGYNGTAILNYIQVPFSGLGQKYSNIYNYLSTFVSSKKEPQKPLADIPIKHEIKPISLKDTSAQKTILIPKKSVPCAQAELSLENRTVQLCDSIEKATSILLQSTLISDLFKLLYQNPQDVTDIIYRRHRRIINALIRIRDRAYEKNDKLLYGNINQCLAIIGYVDHDSIKHKGINILALDGGGARGFVTIEILKNLEKLCDKPIHKIFDYICGTSTGAVLAALVGIYKLPLDEIERQYKHFIKEIFSTNRATGIGNLMMTYAYYDTKVWENMLKEAVGDTLVINSAKEKDSCKIALVSNVTTPNHMRVFLFRNYSIPSYSQSHYDGTIRHRVWEALRASSAAPGYYEDFKLDGYVFHDGGLLANNPTPIALHEVKHLWPSAKTNCIVSIGNGRYKPEGYLINKANSISLRQKITRIVGGISCTETVHNMMLDLLPTKIYFRFNPYLSEEFHLDENRPIKWKLMQFETNMYMRRNKYKFEMAAKNLLVAKTPGQKFCEMFQKRYLSPI
ncbi:calcium-independent phospholipase A2-gamma-like [Brachionus plicatilis]|uniref:Calcium-independent phospholipase A2-gamma-like n=1 Tax=Brachionus plicatilis TaxID=10195 RepID=A0A3M7RU14_BRAPC|nr:calcium-independent phospholipase A2-gamma-like [Brachionus plicatilis]